MIFEGSLLLLSERTSSTAKKKVRDTPTWVQTRIFVPSTTSFKARVSFRQGAKRPWAHVSAKHPVISGAWLSAFVFPGQTCARHFLKNISFCFTTIAWNRKSLFSLVRCLSGTHSKMTRVPLLYDDIRSPLQHDK